LPTSHLIPIMGQTGKAHIMKKFLSVGIAVVALALGAGVLLHAWISTRQDSPSSQDAESTPPPKAVLQPQDLPPEVVAAVKKVLPSATVEAVQGKNGKYQLQLAWGGKTGKARLRMTGDQVAGMVGENLPVTDMPGAMVAAFTNAVPGGKVGSFSKVTWVGGDRDGQVVYQWDWGNGNNCNGEASLDGKKITMTDEIASSALPPAVTEAVTKAFPQASVEKTARRVNKNGRLIYQLKVTPGDGSDKLTVTATATGELKTN
jgi:hypothetical protein